MPAKPPIQSCKFITYSDLFKDFQDINGIVNETDFPWGFGDLNRALVTLDAIIQHVKEQNIDNERMSEFKGFCQEISDNNPASLYVDLEN